jgi:hypothetical protein
MRAWLYSIGFTNGSIQGSHTCPKLIPVMCNKTTIINTSFIIQLLFSSTRFVGDANPVLPSAQHQQRRLLLWANTDNGEKILKISNNLNRAGWRFV